MLKTRKGTGWKFGLSAPQLRSLGPEPKPKRVTRPWAKRQTPKAKGRIFRVRLTRAHAHSPLATRKMGSSPVGPLYPCPHLHKERWCNVSLRTVLQIRFTGYKLPKNRSCLLFTMAYWASGILLDQIHIH